MNTEEPGLTARQLKWMNIVLCGLFCWSGVYAITLRHRLIDAEQRYAAMERKYLELQARLENANKPVADAADGCPSPAP